MKTLTLLLLFIPIMINSEKNTIEIPSIFSDNMVLQQNSEVKFWGKAEPGLAVNITASWGESAKSVVNIEGSWWVEIKTPEAGGPHEIKIQIAESVITYKNVLIGEVWLCSGQSNMEMPLEGWPPSDTISNSKQEIKNAYNPNIRFFTVNRAVSHLPEFNVNGHWQECDSLGASKFSATAYFFGKKLFEELKVPIGLINTSWGGTPIEAWTSEEYLRKINVFDSTLDLIASSEDEIIKQRKWIENHTVIDISRREFKTRWHNLEFDDDQCALKDYDDGNWRRMILPTIWEATELGNFDGAVWFRKKIKIPGHLINKDLILELGPIDDMDRTYVNGVLVGKIEDDGFWQVDRIYNIPKEINDSPVLTIAVRVVDNQGGGGIYGDKSKMKIYSSDESLGPVEDREYSISGEWKYLPVAEFLNAKFYIYGAKGEAYFSRPKTPVEISAYTPTILYNAMISPLIPYTIKGVIWYQGEANTGNPSLYSTQLPLMIRNWRDDWMLGEFPFYFVQIAPYDYGIDTHSEILRESQLKSLYVPNTGIVVTLDIGNPKNIHPSDKKDVGERLALWALAKNYNKHITYSGPLYKSMEVESNKIIISFDYAEGGLIVKELNGENNFLIAGDDRVFKKATVKVDGKKLIVSNTKIKKPIAVRYAWSNTTEATLFNKEGLPASSFRTDGWNN